MILEGEKGQCEIVHEKVFVKGVLMFTYGFFFAVGSLIDDAG